MNDAEVSLFLVTSFVGGPYCAAIYEIKFGGGGGGGGGSKIPRVSPLLKAFKSCLKEYRPYSPVGCDISGSHMCLMSSYWLIKEEDYKQYRPLLFDTISKKVSDLHWINASKPFPKVMAVRGSFFVLAGGTRDSPHVQIKPPSFEQLGDEGWSSSSLPEIRFQGRSRKSVSGYAIIEDCILISVSVFNSSKNEFYCYKVGSSMKEWQAVNKAGRRKTYNAFSGKAEYVEDCIYAFGFKNKFFAYPVIFSGKGNRVIKSLGVPKEITGLDFETLPLDYRSFAKNCLVHLGGRIFCMMKTALHFQPLNFQCVSILIVKVSPEMKLSKLYSALCDLNIENLGQANLTSLCLDSQGSKVASKIDFWTRGPKVLSEDLISPCPVPMPVSVPEVESVYGFLQRLGLDKYLMIFENEEIDMAALVHITNDDLKALGLPELARKNIFSALGTEVQHVGA
ncbi:uncharacterized protein LOC132269577 [Cornus florida]|uniref:uncharacterized protein LOC132269577 n=1 Tax=Cornus florida TaxID=4283 RepID=UPI00289C0A86|nr:uncharacterized protein LOC132269577 [Cornus florida]